MAGNSELARPELLRKAALIRLAIFDVDGVLTDGRLYLSGQGDICKAFHIRDGFGLKLLMEAGLAVAVISGRRDASVERRLAELGISLAYLGVTDKLTALQDLQTQLNLTPAQIAYTGDDWIDLPVMARVGLSIAVSDADPWVLERADWCTVHQGGAGAVREVCELLLEAHGLLADLRRSHVS